MIPKRAKYYYENGNEIQKLIRRRKNKKKDYGKNRYHNMSEEKKQRLKEYKKNYLEAKKAQYNNQ